MSEIRQAQCLGDSFSSLVQQLTGRVKQTIPWHRRHRAERPVGHHSRPHSKQPRHDLVAGKKDPTVVRRGA